MRQQLAVLFGIDPRSLAAFRMGLGLLLDLAIRATALAAHYTDAGIMPRTLILAQFPGRWRWSIHWLTASHFNQRSSYSPLLPPCAS